MTLTINGSEQRHPLQPVQVPGCEVGVNQLFHLVVSRHLMELTALLMEPQHPPLAGWVIVLCVHADDSSYAGEAIDHDAEEGSIPCPGDRGCINAINKVSGLIGV